MLINSLDGLDVIEEITLFDRIEVVERDLDAGHWSITLPLGGLDSPAYNWLNAANAGIEVSDPDTDFRFGGPATRAVIEHTKARSTLTIEGTDFQALLATRREWPYPQNLSDWWKSQYPDPPQVRSFPLTSAVYWIFDQNAGPAALPQRRIPNIELGPDPATGGTKTFLSVGDLLIDSIRYWLTDTPFTARLRLKRERVGAGSAAALVFECGARPYSQFALTDATVDTWTIEDRAASASWILAMGGTWKDGVEAERLALGLTEDDPDPPVRYITEIADPLVDQTWKRPYNELFINRPSLAFDFTAGTGALTDAAADQLRREGPKRALQIPDISITTYGQDLHIGWLVPTALLSEDQTAAEPSWNHLPITVFKYTANPDGEQLTVDIGDKIGSPVDGIFKSINQVAEDVKTMNLMLPSSP